MFPIKMKLSAFRWRQTPGKIFPCYDTHCLRAYLLHHKASKNTTL